VLDSGKYDYAAADSASEGRCWSSRSIPGRSFNFLFADNPEVAWT
jgi:hypothetical protein